MKAFIKYLFTMVEGDPGVLSCTRVIVLLGSLCVVVTICAVFALCAYRGEKMPEVPLSTSTFALTLLASLLGAKAVQTAQESKSPAPFTP